MTASSSPLLAFPKARPRLLDKRERDSALTVRDRIESAKVRARSAGFCEVRERKQVGTGPWPRVRTVGCHRPAAPGNHHLIGGSGKRNRGKSILAEHRLAVCQRCHDEITGRVLQPVGTQEAGELAATVIYERIGAGR